MDLDNLFQQIKKQKHLSQQNLSILKQQITKQKITKLNLWNISSTMKILLSVGKFQLYLMAFAGIVVFPYMMYEKYLDQPGKGGIYMVVTPSVSLLMLAPLLYFRRFYKKILKQISYNPTTNQFQLTSFNNSKTYLINPTKIQTILTKNQRIQQLIIKQNNDNDKDTNSNSNHSVNKYSVEGLGVWESIQVFKYIVEKKELL